MPSNDLETPTFERFAARAVAALDAAEPVGFNIHVGGWMKQSFAVVGVTIDAARQQVRLTVAFGEVGPFSTAIEAAGQPRPLPSTSPAGRRTFRVKFRAGRGRWLFERARYTSAGQRLQLLPEMVALMPLALPFSVVTTMVSCQTSGPSQDIN